MVDTVVDAVHSGVHRTQWYTQKHRGGEQDGKGKWGLGFLTEGMSSVGTLSVCLGNTQGTLGFRVQSPEPSCPLCSQASLPLLQLVMGPVQLSPLHLCYVTLWLLYRALE